MKMSLSTYQKTQARQNWLRRNAGMVGIFIISEKKYWTMAPAMPEMTTHLPNT